MANTITAGHGRINMNNQRAQLMPVDAHPTKLGAWLRCRAALSLRLLAQTGALAVIGSALVACTSLDESHTNRFDLQGHRGARGLAPENTLAAFDRAMELGVSTLELDIGITRDGGRGRREPVGARRGRPSALLGRTGHGRQGGEQEHTETIRGEPN